MNDLHYSDEVCDRARVSRDARFDGLFFTGVKTTGIYCRPICPVRPAQRKNVAFFPSAASAAAAGFRPCLRCRPEAAPGTPAWSGTAAVVSRALRLIDQGALDSSSVEVLAARVGLGARHLRRLFRERVGATPAQVARTRRLHFAKKLIDETELAMSEVALCSGFGSVRRFNDAFQATYGRSPSELRKRRGADVAVATSVPIELRLAFRPPFDWTHFCRAYCQEQIPGVEEVRARRLVSAVSLGESVFLLEAGAVKRDALIELRLSGIPPSLLALAVSRARRVLDVDANPHEIAHRLKGLVGGEGAGARRIPGLFNPFGYLVRCVAASHCGVKVADRFLAELTYRYGKPIEAAPSQLKGFPEPTAIIESDHIEMGLSRTASYAVDCLAEEMLGGSLDLVQSPPSTEIAKRLSTLFGSREPLDPRYVAMRITSDPDAFSTEGSFNQETTTGREAWSPWSSYAQLANTGREQSRS